MVEIEEFPNLPPQQCRPPTITVEKNVGATNVEEECVPTNVEKECVTTKCGKIRCENMWEYVRMCVSKCGCTKFVILDNVPTYGTYPNVEMTPSPRSFNKLHCSHRPRGKSLDFSYLLTTYLWVGYRYFHT